MEKIEDREWRIEDRGSKTEACSPRCSILYPLSSILYILTVSWSVAYAQPPADMENFAPATPLIWGMPVEAISDDVAPFSAVDCFAEIFAKHQRSLQVLGGAYFSPVGLGPKTQPRFNFSPIDVRLGCMLYAPCPEDCCVRGNIEALLEFTTAPVFFGFGDIIVGPTVLLRYNFVQPDWRLVPYLQAGGGFVYNDAYRDKTQRALGQAGEFYLQATGGLHLLLSPRCSVDLEGGYIHISNAGTNERNGGINALGGSLGLTFFLGCRHGSS